LPLGDFLVSLYQVAASEGERITIGGFVTVVKAPGEATAGSVAVVEHTLAPGLLGAPPHRHSREDETSYVLEGELTVQIGDETAVLGPGAMVVKPRGLFHAFWNAGGKPVRFLEVISPAGFERYFEELAELIPSEGPPDMAALTSLAAQYGMEFQFERLPELLQRHGLRLG
jgi:quercetin dioxygenase-like cupin family protein